MQTLFGKDYAFITLFHQNSTFSRDPFLVETASQLVTTKQLQKTKVSFSRE